MTRQKEEQPPAEVHMNRESELRSPVQRKTTEQPFTGQTSDDVVGSKPAGKDASGVKVDPRWPYLNRWSSMDVSPQMGQAPPAAKTTAELTPSEKKQLQHPEADMMLSMLEKLPTEVSEVKTSEPRSSPQMGQVPATKTTVEQTPAEKTELRHPEADKTMEQQPARQLLLEKEKPPTEAATNRESEKGKGVNPATLKPFTLQSSLGAWAKPIQFGSSSLPNASVQVGGKETDHQPLSELWPSLTTQRNAAARKHFKETTQAPQKQVGLEDDVRFPWAARMNPASRNLYRAVEPEYLEDGTPKVIIPNHVLLQGLENQKEYILGQFFRCSAPPGGLIHAVFNKLWGKKCSITIRKMGESNYLFHIPDEGTRKWVLQRGLWHVDDCLMFVAPWNPKATLAIPEIKTIPVWVTLKKIPNILYSIKGISHIASGLGAPMATYKPLLDPILMEEAKILVEVELSKAFPPRIAASDEKGFISMVDVEYAWIPTTCTRCGQLGHKVKRCLKSVSEKENVDSSTAPISAATSPSQTTPAPAHDIEVPPSPTLAPPSIDTSVDAIPAAPPAIVETTIDVASPKVLTSDNILATNDSPPLESASSILNTDDSLTIASVPLESEQSEICLGTNKFASLISTEGEEDDIMELMTPPGKRILRDRPVKASAKAQESNWQVKGRGRGSGRGNRGRGRGGQG